MNLNSKNIYLIGMMGSGKSTVGELLSKKMGMDFADIDSHIEKNRGQTVAQIFATYGETHFRNLETKALKSPTDSIVACGGGIVLRNENRTFLRSNGIVVLLTAPLNELFRRVSDLSSRPLLNKAKDTKKTLNHIWKARKTQYINLAHFTIQTDGRTPEEVCNEIIDKVL